MADDHRTRPVHAQDVPCVEPPDGDERIMRVNASENGLVAWTGSLTLMEVKGWEGAKPLTLANPGKVLTTCIILSLQPSLQVSHNHHIRGASFLPI